MALGTFTFPLFTAEHSLYASRRHYASAYVPGNAEAALAAVTGLPVLPQQENCCGCEEQSYNCWGCCNADEVCVVNADGNNVGCCLGTPCFDDGGNPTGCCDNPTPICCGENGCKGGSGDPCTVCGDPCPDTMTCCAPKGRKPFCTDVSSDLGSCGACFNACPPGTAVCFSGQCLRPGQVCNGVACSNEEVCAKGQCVPLSRVCNGVICSPEQVCKTIQAPGGWVQIGPCCIPDGSSATCHSLSDCCSNFCNESNQCDCFIHGDQAFYGPQSCCPGLEDSNGICCNPGQTGCVGGFNYDCCDPGQTCCNGKCCPPGAVCVLGKFCLKSFPIPHVLSA